MDGDAGVVLSWEESLGAITYDVVQSRNPNAIPSEIIKSGVAGNSTIIENLDNGGVYFFAVRAVNAAGVSSLSNIVDSMPRRPIVATGGLVSAVRVLTESENQAITAEDADSITFNIPINLRVGMTFLTENGAHVVQSISIEGERAIVGVRPPAIAELFQTLNIEGTVSVNDGTFEPAAGIGHPSRPDYSARAWSYEEIIRKSKIEDLGSRFEETYPIDLNYGNGISLNGSIRSQIGLDFSYSFDSAIGGLRSASVTADGTISSSVGLSFAQATDVSAPVRLGIFRIPLPVTLTDGLLNAIGIRLASIVIPVDLLVRVRSDIQARANETTSVSARVSSTFEIGREVVTSADTSGNAAVTGLSVTPNGAPLFANATATGTLSIQARPALAFLNAVSLAGVDFRIGPYVAINAQIVEGAPPFCIKAEAGIDTSIFAFFKTIGVDISSDPISQQFPLLQPESVGTCRLSSIVTAVIRPRAEPPVYQQAIAVDVSVLPSDPVTAGARIPTGSVVVMSGEMSCVANIDVRGNGTCEVLGGMAGTATPVIVNYSGDRDFDPARSMTAVDISRAATITVVAVEPLVLIDVPTEIEVSVLRLPSDEGPSPTGSVEVTDQNGATICSVELDPNGRGVCNAVFNELGVQSLSGTYSSDRNNDSSLSSNVGTEVVESLAVIESGSFTLTGSYSEIGDPDTTNFSRSFDAINPDIRSTSVGGTSGNVGGGAGTTVALIGGNSPETDQNVILIDIPGVPRVGSFTYSADAPTDIFDFGLGLFIVTPMVGPATRLTGSFGVLNVTFSEVTVLAEDDEKNTVKLLIIGNGSANTGTNGDRFPMGFAETTFTFQGEIFHCKDGFSAVSYDVNAEQDLECN